MKSERLRRDDGTANALQGRFLGMFGPQRALVRCRSDHPNLGPLVEKKYIPQQGAIGLLGAR